MRIRIQIRLRFIQQLLKDIKTEHHLDILQ